MKKDLVIVVLGVFIFAFLGVTSFGQGTSVADQGESLDMDEADDEPDLNPYGSTPGNDANKPIKILISKYSITFDPLLYDTTHNNKVGQNQPVVISQFDDRREGFEPQSTHVGTLYGMVYHQPMIEIHSMQPLNLAMQNVMKKLLLANSFRVSNNSDTSEGALIMKGNVNKFWVGIYHSMGAEVDIDIKLINPNSSEIVWSGKAKGSREKKSKSDAGAVFFQGTLGNEKDMVPFLSEVLGEAISTVWAEKGLRNALAEASSRLAAKETVKQVAQIKPDPSDAKANLKVGISFYELGQFDEAIKSLKRATTLRPKWARAHYSLGLAFSKSNNRNAAVEQYDILKDLDENYAKKLFDIIHKTD